jgi:hypothetical protein
VSSRTYRVYCLDGSGRIARGEWMEANHDEDAKLIASQSGLMLTGSCGKGDGS